MPSKIIDVAGIGPVQFVRRTGARSIRISIDAGAVRVSLPYWVPYATAVAFAATKADWAKEHLAIRTVQPLSGGQAIGKAHRLSFVPGPNVAARVKGTVITVAYPADMASDHLEVQAKARQAAIRALRAEAEKLLPARVRTLAAQHGYEYQSISVKQLKRRWGSCDQHGNLTFNLFVMQLPWDLIDYVILHELNHTVHMNHSAAFWSQLANAIPGLPAIRKRMRSHQPVVGA